MLGETATLYKEAYEVDKTTITKSIIKYIVTLEVDMRNIKKQIPTNLWNFLIEIRKEVVDEARLREESLERKCAPL